MNTEQQTDLTTWLTRQDQPLPESLKMAFVERALEELKDSEEARKKFNAIIVEAECLWIVENEFQTIEFNFYDRFLNEILKDSSMVFNKLPTWAKTIVIQTLLSRIDGKAVLEFLDVEIRIKEELLLSEMLEGTDISFQAVEALNSCLEYLPKTLQEKMAFANCRALSMEGKNLEEALEVVTKIYIINTHV